MALPNFDELFRRADALAPALPVAAVGGADQTVLETLRGACDRGWVRPIFVDDEAEVRRIAAEAGVNLNGFTLVHSAEPAAAAVALARRGEARMLMKGRVATPALLRAMLD